MAVLVDLTLLQDSKRCFRKLLDQRGIAYFLKKEGHRLFELEPSKVELIVRAALRVRAENLQAPPAESVDYCRTYIRRELIRRVAETMLRTGL